MARSCFFTSVLQYNWAFDFVTNVTLTSGKRTFRVLRFSLNLCFWVGLDSVCFLSSKCATVFDSLPFFFWRSSKVTWTMSFSLLYHPCIFYTSLRSILFKEYCFIDYYFSLDRNFKHSLGSKFWYMVYLEKGFDALNGIW